ncbi:MAG: DUF4129 domain-containing protein [Bifidobacteriaceae bacterium]|jgi:hypothetical protein|nr:DUF4129 domain-containing protein [Bifidobacteriaceae bacterium]
MGRRGQSALAIGGAGVLCLLVLAGSVIRMPFQAREWDMDVTLPTLGNQGPAAVEPSGLIGSSVVEISPWVKRILLGLIYLLLAAITLWLRTWWFNKIRGMWESARQGRERRPRNDSPAIGVNAPAGTIDLDLDQVADAVELALRALDQAATPRDGVVAAWVALEEAALRQGVPRDPAQTPTEFTVALLGATPAPPAATAALCAMYHQARFSSRPVADADCAQAATHLRAIIHALQGVKA